MIQEKIEKYLGFVPEYVPEITASGQVVLQDDGFGTYIVAWSVTEKEQPTTEDLLIYD